MSSSYKVLFQTPFIAIHERDGYVFLHEARSNGKLIVLLPYRRSAQGVSFLARVEVCPAHGMIPEVNSITGGVSLDGDIVGTALRELREEAGYTVQADELQPLGEVRPSKSADTVAYVFAIDVSDKIQDDIHGDGSRWEQGAGVKWLDLEQGLQVADPLFVTALARLQHRLSAALS